MEWQGRTDGNRWMQQQLINCFRFLSLHIYYMGVAVVVPFYMLFGKGFKASYGFYRQHMGWGTCKSFWWCYKNHYRFGQVMIDRFARYAGKTFRITTENLELYNELEKGPDAFAMLSAHVGNYEMGGYTLVAKSKCIYMLVFGQETQTVMENRQEQFGKTNIRMVPVGNGMNHLFAINEALTTGQILSMTADRRFGSEKAVPCNFFGAEALFPMGPFATVIQRDVPTLVVLVVKTGTRSYHAVVKRLPMPEAHLPRKERITLLAQAYANELENVVRQYPEQWFNFFNIWTTTTCQNPKQ